MRRAIAGWVMAVSLVIPFGALRAQEALRPLDLLQQADRHLGKTVVMDIVEPLRGPATKEALARAEYGQVEVSIPEGHAATLSLVPGNFHPNDPARYRDKFDRVLTSPLRVRGELLRDEEMSKEKRPAYVFRVVAVEPLTLGPPMAVGSLAEIAADPRRFDRKVIDYEGSYRHGFEVSALDKDIWLATDSGAAVLNKPPASSAVTPRRVRVTGILFARPGAHYGHMGGYRYQLQATRLEYLP